MKLKPGYKRTEVGVIPNDWDVSSFKQQFNISAGGDANPMLSVAERDDTHPYPIYSNALTNRGLYGYCSYADHPAHSITITARGRLGVAAYRDHRCTAIGRVLVLVPRQRIAGQFFAEFINSRVRFAVESTGVPQLTAPQVGGYLLAVPPYREQRAIAEALGDVDALLEGLDRLIAKKRDLKQAAMQQLLTGQTRLPGFSGKCRTRRLGEIASIRNQKVLPSNVAIDTLCVELDHIGQGNGKLLGYSRARVSTSSKYRFYSGDVLFGRLRSYLRKFWYADRDGICSTEIWPLVTDSQQADSGFLHAIVQSDRFIEVAGISYGTHMPRTDWEVVRSFVVRLPRLREQQAITTILSDMDAEISALESRRDKTRDLKQAMMQELLTGKTRLLKPEVAHA